MVEQMPTSSALLQCLVHVTTIRVAMALLAWRPRKAESVCVPTSSMALGAIDQVRERETLKATWEALRCFASLRLIHWSCCKSSMFPLNLENAAISWSAPAAVCPRYDICLSMQSVFIQGSLSSVHGAISVSRCSPYSSRGVYNIDNIFFNRTFNAVFLLSMVRSLCLDTAGLPSSIYC